MERTMEERLSALEQKVACLEDRACIENLMAKHYFWFSMGQGRRIAEELWSKSDDASIEYGASGVYRKHWKVKSFYVKEKIPGCLTTFTAANRWLTVSADGQQARGVWMVIGTETDAGDLSSEPPKPNDQRRILFSSETGDQKAYRAEVLLQSHEVLFRKETGEWKIVCLHIGEFFRCPAGSDWVRYARERQVTDGMWLEAKFETPDPLPWFENLPSSPTTWHWQYDPDAVCQMPLSFEALE